MKKIKKLFQRTFVGMAAAFAATILASCAAMYDVVSDTDAQTDFSRFSTFAWLRDKNDSGCSSHFDLISRDNIRNYVGIELAKQGFSVVPDTPDVLLRLIVRHHPSQVVVTQGFYPGYYHHRYYGRSRYYFPYPVIYYYDAVFVPPPVVYIHTIPAWEGIIALEMFERATGRMVWSASARVDVHDRRYLNRHIHPAVEAMMKRFPVRTRNAAVPGDVVYGSD